MLTSFIWGLIGIASIVDIVLILRGGKNGRN